MYYKLKGIVIVLPAVLLTCSGLVAGQSQSQSSTKLSIPEVIQRFAAAESENKAARNNYTFTQELDIKTLGPSDAITGQFHRVSDVVYDDLGQRVEKITYFPASTLTELRPPTPEDMQDLAGVQPFALTIEDLPKYQVDYTGQERIDELDLYVFSVKPKVIRKGERYFEGRLWVDTVDLQIVKAAGQAVPEVGDQKFPRFESYRENIDGRYWFPTYVYADDVLEFKKGPSVHMRMVVRYTKYKKFTTSIRVVEGGEAAPDEDEKKEGAAEPPKLDPKKPAAKADPKKKPPQP